MWELLAELPGKWIGLEVLSNVCMGHWEDNFQVSNPLLNPHLPFSPHSFVVLLAENSHGVFILTAS